MREKMNQPKKGEDEMNKVYCKNCRFLRLSNKDGYYCKKGMKEKVSWFGKCRVPIKTKPPSAINRNNNCELYKRQWWKFWVK